MDDRDAPFAIVIDIRPDPQKTRSVSIVDTAILSVCLVMASFIVLMLTGGFNYGVEKQFGIYVFCLLIGLPMLAAIREGLTRKQRRSP